ncbi:hypothetical protein C8R42DRAFT_637588 [Lentinula raphanica]|nr:hypothetical protein C8R42DRAFT_637588 [Lentinula raphanica]
MPTHNPPPRPNFIASYADGCIVFIAYPRLDSGLRVPANQVFKLLKKRALDIRCFCDRPASVFRVNKPDSLLNGDFVAMCSRKGCNYFVNMTEAYDQASYLWPVDPQSSSGAPVNDATLSARRLGTSSNITAHSSTRQGAHTSTRSQRGLTSRFSGYGSRNNPINLATAQLGMVSGWNTYELLYLEPIPQLVFMAVPVKRGDSKKLRQQDALYTFGQDCLNVIPYPRESTGSLKLPSQVWEALTDGSITLRCFHHKRVLVKPKAGNMNGPISVKCPLGFWQQLSIETVHLRLSLLESPLDRGLLSPASSPIPHFTPSFNDNLYYAPYLYNYVPPLRRDCTNRGK